MKAMLIPAIAILITGATFIFNEFILSCPLVFIILPAINRSKFNYLMSVKIIRSFLIISFVLFTSSKLLSQSYTNAASIKVGAEQTSIYLPILKDKHVAVVANPTSTIGTTHLVDTLIHMGIQVKKVFGPEHGFRGDAEAGAHTKNTKDKRTGIPVIALYGSHYKPKPADLKGIDYVIFDIQDVGARFYTYISTMHYVMEACAENHVKFIVFDRPNPNGHYVDGPILESEYKSFVGMHPIPIVHGLTVGELAQMINEEGWLANKVKCDIMVIPCANYNHQREYILPIKPSPNLPNNNAIYLYPSLCLFEGTVISLGRGTDKPFQVYGHPLLKGNYEFTPRSIPNVSVTPPLLGEKCKGYDLTQFAEQYIKNYKKMYLFWILDAYKQFPNKDEFFNTFFNKLAGNATLQEQIKKGLSEEEIRKSWEPGLGQYKEMRKKYLLYDDYVEE